MPLLWISAGFLAGVFLASRWLLPWPVWGALAVFSVGVGVLELRLPFLSGWRKRWGRLAPLPAGFLLAALLAGAARFQAARPIFDQADLAPYNGQGEVRFSAMVVEPPQKRERSIQLRLSAEEILAMNGVSVSIPVSGLALATLPPGGDWRYGDRLELTGELVDPPEGESFSYRAYLARQGVYTMINYPSIRLLERGAGNVLLTGIYAFRDQAYRVLNRLYPQPEAALLSGILLGIEQDIPASLERAFRDTGTAHIIAISGFNIAILAALFSSLAGRLIPDRWLSLLVAILGVAVYTILVGAAASVVRAAVMGGLTLLGSQIGRRNAGLNALAFTGAAMCAFNPDLLWDVSFQLSFSATLGLVWFGVPLENIARQWLEGRFSSNTARRLTGPLSEYFLFTLAAQVTTLPVILYHFQRLSLSSLLANPLVLPPQPLVMTLGGLSALAGMVLYPLGKALSFLVWPLLLFTIRVVESLSRINGGAVVVGQTTMFWAAIYFLALFLLAKNLAFVWQQRARLKAYAGLAVLCLGSVVAWRGFYGAPDGRLHLTVYFTSSGPAVQIQTPQGRYLFIHYGSPNRELNSFLARRMPIFHQRPDGLLLPAGAARALEGLPDFLDRFPPGWILWNSQISEYRSAARLKTCAQNQGIPLLPLESGQSISLGGAARLEALAQEEEGALLGLVSGGVRVVFASGGPESLARLPTNWSSPGVILLLSEASLKDAAPQEWLAFQPGLVIAPAGAPGLPSNWLALDRRHWVEATFDDGDVRISARE
ncbi:MAG: DUF4131 domain-containing protein [Anaerolineae bacterium]|nr:DUF4131 domain-containing protein [Anaerolineae bacterium]